MTEPTKWETAQARMGLFFDNVKELWLQSNNDQRIFIAILLSFSVLFFLLALLWLKWRIVNRAEIRKVQHHAALRSHIQRMNEEDEG